MAIKKRPSFRNVSLAGFLLFTATLASFAIATYERDRAASIERSSISIGPSNFRRVILEEWTLTQREIDFERRVQLFEKEFVPADPTKPSLPPVATRRLMRRQLSQLRNEELKIAREKARLNQIKQELVVQSGKREAFLQITSDD